MTALRSLDAIHLATAGMLVTGGKAVTAFVTYGDRQGGPPPRRASASSLPAGSDGVAAGHWT